MNKAVFLDKDGTLIENVPYNVDPEKIKFFPGTVQALKRLKEQGFKLIVISNQSGVAHGFFEESSLQLVWKDLREKLAKENLMLDAFYYCPHHLDGVVQGFNIECICRKPRPGLLLKAAEEHNINLDQSWMIGDILHDVEAGNRAGCRTILINNGNETQWLQGEYRTPDFFAASLVEAVIEIDNFIANQSTEWNVSNRNVGWEEELYIA